MATTERFVLTETRYGSVAVYDRTRNAVAAFMDEFAADFALAECVSGGALSYAWRPAHEEEKR